MLNSRPLALACVSSLIPRYREVNLREGRSSEIPAEVDLRGVSGLCLQPVVELLTFAR